MNDLMMYYGQEKPRPARPVNPPLNPPQFSAKAKDKQGFVGNAWLNQGKFGKYIALRLKEDLPKGSTVYLSPTRGNESVLR